MVYKHSQETRKKMSIARLGKTPWNKGIKYTQIMGDKNPNWKGGATKPKCSCGNIRGRRAKSCWDCFLKSGKNKGINRYNWKGGLSNPLKMLRTTYEYKQWRKLVFKRDYWTCQICKTKGRKIWADHIKPFALYPESRFDVENGRTLCVDCALKLPTHGNRVFNYKLGIRQS